MADISKITLPSGTTYNIKDTVARDRIDDILIDLSKYTKFLGVTTDKLTDGATKNPITVNGTSVPAENGNIVIYNSKEFIFNGTVWKEFGDLSVLPNMLGDFAYADKGSVTHTPAGTITSSFTGNAVSYTPAGTISQPTFKGDSATNSVTFATDATNGFKPSVSVSGTTAGSVSSTFKGTAKAPEVNSAIFSGTATTNSVTFKDKNGTTITSLSSSASYTPEGSVTSTFSGDNYTPEGTVTTTITPTTATRNFITKVGTPSTPSSFSATVSADETLVIAWTQGTASTVPEKAAQTVMTGASATSTFKGAAKAVSGTVSSTFTGTSATITSESETFTGSVSHTPAGTVTVTMKDYTPAGTVSSTFTGASMTSTGNVAGFAGSVTHKPTGTVSKPTFTGTASSHTPTGSVSSTFKGTTATLEVVPVVQ